MNNTDKFDDTDFREVISDAEEPEKSEEPESGGKGELQESGEKENEYEDTCYICHRPESKAGKMIKIPNEICICADCMQKTFDSMSQVSFPIGDMSNFGNMPNISMINLSELQNLGMMPKSQKLKMPCSARSTSFSAAASSLETTLSISSPIYPASVREVASAMARGTSRFHADLKDKYDKEDNILHRAEVEDIRKYGMIPEFLGRLPVIFALDALSEDMLVQILTEPKNAIIKQYQKLLAMDEVKLEFDEGALHAIAGKARKKEVGARALRAILEEFMLDIMYEIPKDDNIGMVTITGDYIENKGGPIITMRG